MVVIHSERRMAQVFRIFYHLIPVEWGNEIDKGIVWDGAFQIEGK